MCESLKIHVHSVKQVDELDIYHVTEISTAPILYKESDDVIYDLTPEVDCTNRILKQ